MTPWAPRWAGLLGPLAQAPACFPLHHPQRLQHPDPPVTQPCGPGPPGASPSPPGQPGVSGVLQEPLRPSVLWAARVFTPQAWGFCITPTWVPSSIPGSPSVLDSPGAPASCSFLPLSTPNSTPAHRPSSCSAQTGSCRSARRWCTRCLSTRSTSSTPAPRASWPSSQVRPSCPTPAGGSLTPPLRAPPRPRTRTAWRFPSPPLHHPSLPASALLHLWFGSSLPICCLSGTSLSPWPLSVTTPACSLCPRRPVSLCLHPLPSPTPGPGSLPFSDTLPPTPTPASRRRHRGDQVRSPRADQRQGGRVAGGGQGRDHPRREYLGQARWGAWEKRGMGWGWGGGWA